eukprot:1158779-Pelagomonas_calceolata.AAC.5
MQGGPGVKQANIGLLYREHEQLRKTPSSALVCKRAIGHDSAHLPIVHIKLLEDCASTGQST